MNLKIESAWTFLSNTLRAARILTPDNVLNSQAALPAGKAGTAGAAGVMTLGANHGFEETDLVCVKSASGIRYNCVISTHDSTTITLTSGAGDALPTSGAIIVSKRVQVDFEFIGAQLEALYIGADVDMQITLEDETPDVQLANEIDADSSYQWDIGCNETNPVTGHTIASLNAYNLEAIAGTAKVLLAYDND